MSHAELWDLWYFLPLGYLTTVVIEAPILWFGLAPQHSPLRRQFAAFWLTACTYPIVVLVLYPLLMPHELAYILVAETFAPAAECFLFYAAFDKDEDWSGSSPARDMVTIVAANLASFGIGEVLNHYQWFNTLRFG